MNRIKENILFDREQKKIKDFNFRDDNIEEVLNK